VLGELLDSLLDISRLDVAGIRPDIRPFALAPMFERLNSSFKRAAVDRNLSLRFRPTTLWLSSDPVMVERMIGNLVSNSLRYTPTAGRILVAARLRGEEVRIEVRDSGVGIAPEHQAAIFAEFYQVGNPAREPNKGLGLGLSIIDRLARVLDVKVILQSRPGAGTTFALQFPLHRPALRELPERASQSAGRVHLVGQSAELDSCRDLLTGWGYTISRGNASELPPSAAVIISDDEDAAPVRRLAPKAPLIVVNARSQPLPQGAHALPQPIRPAKLRALIGQLQKTLEKSIP
jgi:hypothetical protein